MGLAGVVDGFYPDLLAGWAYDSDHPERPASISLEVNGTIVASFSGDIFRVDLAARNFGTGRYGFNIRPLAYLAPGVNECRVLFAGTDRILGQGARMLVVPHSAHSPDSTPLIDPSSAWNDSAQIGRFYRRGSARNFPPASGTHVLGLFNSGTNYIAQLLAGNEVFGLGEADHRLQNKHAPLNVLSRLTGAMSEHGRSRILYAVSARDPFRWIEAMKNNAYGAEFESVSAPFSIPWMTEEPASARGLAAGFRAEEWARNFAARNIVDYWNRYHAEWIEHGVGEMGHAAILRYEDAVKHPCEIVRILRVMLGMHDPERVTVNVGTAKPEHGTPGDFWVAKRKVATARLKLGPAELAFISANLSDTVCRYLGYERRAGASAELRRA